MQPIGHLRTPPETLQCDPPRPQNVLEGLVQWEEMNKLSHLRRPERVRRSEEEFGSESRDEDVEDMSGLGLLNMDIALRHSIFEEERGQLLNDGRQALEQLLSRGKSVR